MVSPLPLAVLAGVGVLAEPPPDATASGGVARSPDFDLVVEVDAIATRDASSPAAPEPEPEPEPEVDADDDIPLESEDIFEEEPDEGDEAIRRKVVVDVTADPLAGSTPYAAFRHGGGRTVVQVEEAKESGATSVGDLLDKVPGVRTTGSSAYGNDDTRLQVGVRGANPRFSAKATVLLDGVPLAPAPYGNPEMSLFPVSLFSIESVDAVRGGGSVRFGPQTSGGIFNLISREIPERQSIAVFGQADTNGDIRLGTYWGGTFKGIGVYAEYDPRFGSSWRDHSDREVHGGLFKLKIPAGNKLTLISTTHAYYEDAQTPGGLTRSQFEEDPFQNRRPFDQFFGWRVGTALKASVRPREGHALDISTYYSHTFRETTFASGQFDTLSGVNYLLEQPRSFDMAGLQPDYVVRFDHDKLFQDLSIGARVIYESAALTRYQVEADPVGRTTDLDARYRLLGYAGYVGDKLHLLEDTVMIEGGVRLEGVQLAILDVIDDETSNEVYFEPLPSASIWVSPVEDVALFLGYGRSFSPPGFLQIAAGKAGNRRDFTEEISNTWELGIKSEAFWGLYAEATGWARATDNPRDLGQVSVDIYPYQWAWGTELDLEWEPGEIWDPVAGLTLYAGHAWTDSRMVGGPVDGNQVPWFPEHEVWAGTSYGFPFGLKLGVDFEWASQYFTDYANSVAENAQASIGQIPDWFNTNLWMRFRYPLPRYWAIETTIGVRNVFDVRAYSRSDDINGGLMVDRPRTFYFNLGVRHDFMTKQEREDLRQRRRARKTRNAAAPGPVSLTNVLSPQG